VRKSRSVCVGSLASITPSTTIGGHAGVAVEVGVGVGVGPPPQTASVSAVLTVAPPSKPPAAIIKLSPIAPPAANERTVFIFGELIQVSVTGS
jgi:hypothetical protein